MRALRQPLRNERFVLPELRQIAGQAFSRAAGAPLVGGNRVRLLRDAHENYPAWLDAIRTANNHVHFESYIIHEDEIGRKFADALAAKARQGVAVRLIYDWMGALGKASRRFWRELRSGGVEVRCYNPPRLDSPLGWLSRDHRKMLAVDGEVGFVTGLCIGRMWAGDPARPLSRAGYRPLLEAGVRIFEWNGTMLHAKTAVADGHWARVGSTNLNIASWFGNCELDAVIEDDSFAIEMEQMYREDLANATEVVLDKRKLRAPGEPRHRRPGTTSGGGSGGRAAAGAVRIGNAIGAAFTDRRVLGPIEARLAATIGVLLCALAILFVLIPPVLVYPVVVVCAWGGVTLLCRGYQLRRRGRGKVT